VLFAGREPSSITPLAERKVTSKKKKKIKNLTAKLSQELGFGSFCCPLWYFEMFL
jgi:hypothetical protein